ncbi:phage integrase [Pectobacterium carotovorum]|uniref:phage integrase n=1 Tax=Pectobacterium carotovorum TaxID=554 RepID=UPI00381DCFF6
MAVRKQASGKWLCECYPYGREGKRVRKQFATKGEAVAFERFTMEQAENKPWMAEKRDTRKLSDLIDVWYRAHGITLNDGEGRKSILDCAAASLGDPVGTDFNARDFSVYREKRLNGEISHNGREAKISPTTVNRELSYFRALFNELARLGEWNSANPLESVRPYKTSESEMAFLQKDQITRLLHECEASKAKDLLLIVKLCLSTGARWSEAEELTRFQLSPYRVTFTKTKGKRNRTVPISETLYNALPKNNGRLFSGCYNAFRKAMERADIVLPAGQCSHVLRHTFASHFMMNGGNILVLQRILGHTDIKMTMRYAHFSPNHLEDALRLNPLAS